ncbi:MAG TPA: hypothetical protein ENI27_06845 [bacterium]|nr:hypothetical protein [bacterium]
MKTINYSKARNNLKTVMEKVCSDLEPCIITRKKDSNVVKSAPGFTPFPTSLLKPRGAPDSDRFLCTTGCISLAPGTDCSSANSHNNAP